MKKHSFVWWVGLPLRAFMAGFILAIGAMLFPLQYDDVKQDAREMFEGRA